MKRRGRPSLKATQGGLKFAQAMTIVMAFDRARAAKEKWDAAVSRAAKTARKRNPSLSVSDTEVKRVLSRWRSRDAEEVLIFREQIVSGTEVDLPAEFAVFGKPGVTIEAPREMLQLKASPSVRKITAYVRQKPILPRTNAAEKPRKRGIRGC